MPRRNPVARGSRLRQEIEVLECRELLSLAGSLDTSFGAGTGYVAVSVKPTPNPIGSVATPAATLALQADGKIVMAGDLDTSEDSFSILRLNADGTPDSTFGMDGQVFIPTNATGGGHVASVQIESDGKILVVGSVTVAGTTSGSTVDETVVARLNADGTIDTTYGNGGTTEINPGGASAAAIGPNETLVIVGVQPLAVPSGFNVEQFVVDRLNANGVLDTSFGGTGQVAVAQVGDISDAEVAVRPNGQILLSGRSVLDSGTPDQSGGGLLFQLNFDGSRDDTFGNQSVAAFPYLSSGSGFALLNDGQVVEAGMAQVSRINANGSIDTTFGSFGIARVTPAFLASAIAIQADGKIVLTGSTNLVSAAFIAAGPATERLDADGSIDTTYGNTAIQGLAYAPTILGEFTGSALAIRPTGPIVVVGTGLQSGNTSPMFAVAQVLATSTPSPVLREPPADFDGSGKTNISAYIPAAGSFVYRPTDGGADVVVPFGIAGAGQTIPAPGDYTGAGHTEIAAYLPGLGLYAYRPADGGADVVQQFGIAGAGQSIPVPGDYEGTGKDDIAVYLPSIGAYAIRPSGGGPDKIIPFGIAGAGQTIPAPGDYDGSGRTELGVYLPAFGAFVYRPANGGADVVVPFGIAGAGQTIPVPGDYDGSGHDEVAAYFPSLAEFAFRPADGGADVIIPFGSADGSIPVPGDYDGSGHDEVGIYDPAYASFAYRPYSGPDVIVGFGTAGKGQTLPAATPPGALAASLAPVSLTIQAASVSTTAVVPVSPSLAFRKVARTLVAQASPDRSTAHIGESG